MDSVNANAYSSAETHASAVEALVPAVEAHGFAFTYPNGDAGVGPLDWRVENGAFQLLVGATGSGKTTLLRCLKSALAPAGKRVGELAIFGCPADQISARESAAMVGYVAQSPENQMVCDSVWHELAFGLENLGVPQEEMRRRVAEVAHFFGIEPWFRRKVDELSGGQKQMVMLASVLAMQPKLLLLDEPTAQLDPVAEKNFLHMLFRINRELGITVVVATHAPETMTSYATAITNLPSAISRVEDRFVSSHAKETPSALSNPPSAITMRDVYLRYRREDDWVLRGCDLEVRTGSIHALVGGNGCGKSTLLCAIAGVLKPERGRIDNRLADHQAFLPQDPKALFVCDTVQEELREWQTSCGYSDEEVEAALVRFGLADHVAHHPYDLSGGQQQNLALAKVLLTSPELVVLDEPTKGLDAFSKVEVAHILRDLQAGGVTVVLATHDLSFASQVADVVTMLFDGEATCTEPTAVFFSNNLFYRPAEDAFIRLMRGECA